MTTDTDESNKALVIEAFDTRSTSAGYEAAAHFWSPSDIQHRAHIEPGREGLFNLGRALPPTLKYEPGASVQMKIVPDGVSILLFPRFQVLVTIKRAD